MSDSCCSLEFARGGVIDESSVTNSQIVNSTVQASTITASSIEMLASIDTASAVVIAEALAKKLSLAQLKSLAEAIHNAHGAVYGAEPVKSSSGEELPTTVVGQRTFLLGEPDAWEMRKDGLCAPVFRSKA